MKFRFTLFVSLLVVSTTMAGIVQAAPNPVVTQSKGTTSSVVSAIKKPTSIKQPVAKKLFPITVKASALKPLPKKPAAPITLSHTEIKKLVKIEIDNLIKENKLVVSSEAAMSFEKLEKLNHSYSEETPGFQNYYIPAAAIAGVGTFFSASNVGAENLNGTNLASGNAEIGSLTVSERADLEGGLNLITPEQGNIIDSDSGAYLSSGGTWTNASSKDLKENFTELDQNDLLNKINTLSITRWNYKKEASSTTHIGPLAEDFYAAFTVGGSAGQKAISTIDPSGVALAGIQALSKKFAALDWLIEAAKRIGIVIEENLVKVKTLVATVIHTDNLEVGSSDLVSGITIYDKTTKQPMCLVVDNGALQVQSGKCLVAQAETDVLNVTVSTAPVQAEVSLDGQFSTDAATAATTTEAMLSVSDSDQPAAPTATQNTSSPVTSGADATGLEL
jgi:Chaperone of endosialidase